MNLHLAADLRATDAPPQRDRPGGQRNAGTSDEATGTGTMHYRAAESRKSNGMGQGHEQHSQRGRRSNIPEFDFLLIALYQ